MSLMAKLKAEKSRLDEVAETRTNFEKVSWWKPQKGKNQIRILPHHEHPDTEFPFKHVHTHWIEIDRTDGKGKVKIQVRCLRDFEEDCPLCNEYAKLLGRDKEAAKPLKPRESYIYSIIDYKTASVHPYQMPSTVHEQIVGFAEDFSGNIFSIDNGRDWVIEKKVDPRKPVYIGTSYSVRAGLTDTSLNKKVVPLLESQPKIEDLLETKEREKMLAFLGVDDTAPWDKEESDDFDLSKVFEKEAIDEEAQAVKKAELAAQKAKKSVSKSVSKSDDTEDDLNIDEDDLAAELAALGIE